MAGEYQHGIVCNMDITSADDGINANGNGSVSPVVTVNGGDVRIVNTQGMDADGMDSNGNIYINGGNSSCSSCSRARRL